MKTDRLYFGCAYYDEYMPYDRISQDFDLIEKAGMNVVRVMDETWSTIEPTDGKFDFSHLHRELGQAAIREMRILVCIPTCTVPAWLAAKCPSVQSRARGGVTPSGRIFVNDLTNPDFLKYAERMIRRVMEEVKNYPNVIGFQVDSQTRMGDSFSKETQALFLRKMKEHFSDLKQLCNEFGLDYGSQRISSWDTFPDIRDIRNDSLRAAYDRFLRDCSAAFLAWECSILREYMKPDQFITHNFAATNSEGKTGIDPEIEQRDAALPLDMAGLDITHKMKDRFDIHSIAFGGALAESLRRSPYLVTGAQALGTPENLPYPGQIRLAAFAHLSCGANGILYANWHSPHNGPDAFQRGIIGHDLTAGEVYREIADFGREIKTVEPHLLNLKKKADIAILVDHASLTGLSMQPIKRNSSQSPNGNSMHFVNGNSVQSMNGNYGQSFNGNSDQALNRYLSYSDIVREYFDACHEMNLECDILWSEDPISSASYKLVIVPALMSASESLIEKLKKYILPGGTLLLGYKSCIADEEQKLYHDAAPHKMTDCLGAVVENYTVPNGEHLSFTDFFNKKMPSPKGEGKRPKTKADDVPVTEWMELLKPGASTDVLASYVPARWGTSAAIVHHKYGDGHIIYQGCHLESEGTKLLIRRLLAEDLADISLPEITYPLVAHTGTNDFGRTVRYFLNCSEETLSFAYPGEKGRILISSGYLDQESRDTLSEDSFLKITPGTEVFLAPWDLVVIEEDK